jgi:hypothetical protein
VTQKNPVFKNEGATAVWAGFTAVDPALQHLLYEELGKVVAAAPDIKASIGVRRSEAIRALREAFALGGEVPSVRKFEHLRKDHPECDWPSARSVRRWLEAPSWGAALQRAHLDAPPESFGVTHFRPAVYGADEVVAAIRECAADLDCVPTHGAYLRWSRQAKRDEKPGRIPSWGPIVRHFGGWAEALRAAGLITEANTAVNDVSGGIGYASRFVTDEQLIEGLRAAARDLGKSPYCSEYIHFRERMYRSDRRVYPSATTIHRRFRTWDAALECAGLEPFEGRYEFPNRPKKFTDDEIYAAVAAAYAETGDPFTSGVYDRWRRDEISRDVARADEVPGLATIAARLGWAHVLERLTGKASGRPNRFADEVVVAAVTEAVRAHGGRLTTTAYTRWRRAEIDRDERRKHELPCVSTVEYRYGWNGAIRLVRRHEGSHDS